MRQSGVSPARAAILSVDSRAFMSVSITPGAIQLTRIPEGPISFARAFVRPITAALEAEYATSQLPPATRKRLRRVVKHYGWYYLTHFVFRKKR